MVYADWENNIHNCVHSVLLHATHFNITILLLSTLMNYLEFSSHFAESYFNGCHICIAFLEIIFLVLSLSEIITSLIG